jgi:RNA polymerase sigma-70 factor (ECF subfamily)
MPINSASVDESLANPAAWVDQYGDLLFRYASSRVSDVEHAEDLVQETLLSAFRHRKQFDERAKFATWLVAILRRKIADYYRMKHKSPALLDDGTSDYATSFNERGKWKVAPKKWQSSPEELAENAEFWRIYQGCLGDLPAHLSQAFHLREMARLAVEDLTQKLGITPQNLAVRLHRARILLRECLEKKWFLP